MDIWSLLATRTPLFLSAIFLTACGILDLPSLNLNSAPVAGDSQASNTTMSIQGPHPPMQPELPKRPPTPTAQPLIQTAPVVDQERVPLSYYLSASDLDMPPVPPSWTNTENLLILGTDKREGDPVWRTDVIMVVGLDEEQGRAALFSIPRDLYINIPGSRPARINTVDYLGERILWVEGGGPALLSHVIQRHVGIPTQKWVRLNMNGIVDLVDAIGGVTVHLECPLYEPILNLTTNQWEYFTLPAGDVELDGEDAAWFTRLRLHGSDIGRSQRQRQLLWAIRNQALNTNLLLRLPELWNAFGNIYETDIGLFEMMQMAGAGLSLGANDIHSGGLRLTDLETVTTEGGAQVLRIANPEQILAIAENVWQAPSVAGSIQTSESSESVVCPPEPVGPPANPYGEPSSKATVEAANGPEVESVQEP
ncbi:MAG: LCP family protein [Chloroflexota bacterium]